MAAVVLLVLPPTALAAFGDRTLRKGSRGADVRTLQRTLTGLSLPTTADGMYGRSTVVSVRRWELRSKRRSDGVVTRADARALLRALAARSPRPSEPAEQQETTALSPLSTTGGTDPNAPATSATPTADGYIFPIRGRHSYGTAVNRFGDDRGDHSHGGQDILAACGTKLVAARQGTVSAKGMVGGAGNYIVIKTDDGHDHVYYHLQSLAIPAKGSAVTTGQHIGYVGSTGNSSACHLHFELWEGRWFGGGRAIDPLPSLKAWDAAS